MEVVFGGLYKGHVNEAQLNSHLRNYLRYVLQKQLPKECNWTKFNVFQRTIEHYHIFTLHT